MQPSEQKIYQRTANARNAVFRPLNKFLTAIGVTPNAISYLGVLLMVGFVFSVSHHPKAAYWLLIARILSDVVDGPLARYQQVASDRGKFIDVLMDNLGFGLFIFGVIKAGLLSGLYGSIYLYSTELVVVLMTIRTALRWPKTDWLFYSSAGSFPYNFIYLSYILFWVYAFFGHNYLNGAAQIFSVLLILKALADYRFILRAKLKK